MMPNCFHINETTFAQDVILDESPGSVDEPKRVLIVMDALKEFSIDLIEWVLRNFTFGASCRITLLGIKPWLNIPLSAKTWSDIWSLDLVHLEDLFSHQERNGPKYQKVKRLSQLCQQYGVMPEIKIGMGHPLRLLVAEQISSLHATLVVFDRHHDKKYINFYAEKIPCNMLAVKDNGEVHLIKKRSCIDDDVDDRGSEIGNTPVVGSPPSSRAYSFTSSIPEQLIKLFMPRSRLKRDKDSSCSTSN